MNELKEQNNLKEDILNNYKSLEKIYKELLEKNKSMYFPHYIKNIMSVVYIKFISSDKLLEDLSIDEEQELNSYLINYLEYFKRLLFLLKLNSKDIFRKFAEKYAKQEYNIEELENIVDGFGPFETNGDSKIALVISKETEEILLRVNYSLEYRGEGEEKAQNMYEGLEGEKLINTETYEVVIKNVYEIIDLLLKQKGTENIAYKNIEELIHTHKNTDKNRIMCYSKLLKDEQEALDTFKTWLLLTAGLIYLKDFSEANTYIDENEGWYDKLDERYTIRI